MKEKVATVSELPPGGVLSDAASILAIQDMEVKRVFVPQWNQHVYLRTPSALAKGRFEASVAGDDKEIRTLKLRLCAMTLCDQQGQLLFSSEKDGVSGLGSKNSQAIEVIATEALKMIQITETDIEDATKN